MVDQALQLAQLFPEFQQRNDGYYVHCPCHEDESPSLCITNGTDKPLYICRAGCDQAAVTKALKPYRDKINPSEDNGGAPAAPAAPKQIIAEYNYLDEKSKLLYQVVRYEPKDFRQRKPDATAQGGWMWKLGNTRKILYRLPEILKEKIGVAVVEGEKDVLALVEIGIPATCNAGGAGKWRRSYSESLRGKNVYIIADRDGPGRRHAEDVASQLFGLASSIRVLEPPFPHKDTSDWIEKGKADRTAIISTIKATPEWTPAAPPLDSVITHGLQGGDAVAAQEHTHEWPTGLMNGEKGPRAISGNILYALRAHPSLKGLVVHDTFTTRTTVSRQTPWGTPQGTQWSDKDDNLLAEFLQHEDIRIGPDAASSAATTISHEQQIDSLQDYLTELKWDGTPRLGYVSNLLGSPGDLSAVLISKWIISAVARAMRPGCQVDHVLVLEGSQGIRKSTALRTLFDPIQRGWFRDDLPPLNSKDAQQFLEGTWCVEIAELDAVNSRRAELEHVKAFLSRRVDSYRPPYGRRVQDFPRRVIFAGSTNDAHYLKDTTGNRRWWPIACDNPIDIDKLAAGCDQMWAEAVQRFRAGEEWWLDTNLPANEDLAREQESRRNIDPWEPIVVDYLSKRLHCTMDDILHHLNVPMARRGQIESNRVQRILSMMGWCRKNLRDGNRRWWAYVSDPNATWKSMNGEQQGDQLV